MNTKTGYSKLSDKDKFPAPMLATAGVEQFSIPDGSLVRHQSELYQRLSWVNIAVGAVARLSAEVKFNVKQLKDEHSVDVTNHPFELLLRRPNPLQSRFEFIQATCAYYCLTGNAFWWLNKSSPNSPPAEMWIISPHQLKVVPDKQSYIHGYLYDPGDGSGMPIDKTKIVHFKSFHPTNPFVGLSPIEAIAIVASGDLKAQEWNTRFFGDSNARLPGILAFADPIGDGEWQKLKEDARNKSNKREIMMLRNTGAGGVQWLQAGASQKDMEYLNGRKFTKEEIFGIFAPGLANIMDVNATEANAKIGESTLLRLAIHPMLSAMAEKITNDLLPLYGKDLTGEFEEVRDKDRALALQEQTAYSDVHTIQEIRSEFYDDEPLGDAMLPVEMKIKTQPQPQFATSTELIPPVKETKSDDELNRDLLSYQRKACNMLTKNKPLDFDFESSVIGKGQLNKIKSLLKNCKTKEEIKTVFEKENQLQPDGLSELIGALFEATKALREA